jgi:hydroxymethylbilane synthase
MSEHLVIGTRASHLALAQCESVTGALREAWPDLETSVEAVRTTGDQQAEAPLEHLPGVGFFVKELEAALLDGRVDLAVHSMKDVPTVLPEGLEVEASVPERADPRDCLVTLEGMALDGLPEGARVGTSSPRRRAMLLAARSDLEVVPLRGNVDTRLRKLEDGQVDATVLARAGLVRLGVLSERAAPLGTDAVLPAAGQGALGLEFRADDERVRRLVAAVNVEADRQAVSAERAVLRRLGAGCRTPIGVLGRATPDGELVLEAYLLRVDGRRSLRRRVSGAAAGGSLGGQLAEALLADGADRFLEGHDGDTDA